MEIVNLDKFHIINKSILERNASLVKVGVYETDDLIKFKEIYPGSNVVAYEASENNYLKATKCKAIDRLYNKAVGNLGKIKFHIFTNPVSNSIYPRHQKDPNCVLSKSVTVESIDLETVFKENNLKYLNVLILNCEGGELPIMKSLYRKTLRDKIGQICVSFHDPRIYPRTEKDKILNDLAKFYHIVRGSSDYIPDYLFIRKL